MSDKINPTIVENNGKLIHVLEDGTRKELSGNISVDESRLLPNNPINGDIPIYSNSINKSNYNTNDTILLIQDVGENGLENMALGKPGSSKIQNYSDSISISDGYLIYPGGSNAWLEFVNSGFNANGTGDWTIDVRLIVENTGSAQYIFGPANTNQDPQIAISRDSYIYPYNNSEMAHDITYGEEFTYSLSWEHENKILRSWKNGKQMKKKVFESNGISFGFSDATEFWLGRNAVDPGLKGKVKYWRLTNACLYGDNEFTPPIDCYFNAPNGEWQNYNLESRIEQEISKISKNKIIIQRPISNDSLYPILVASQTQDFSETQIIDPYTNPNDRNKIEVFDGNIWNNFPEEGGLGTPFDNMEVSFDVNEITYTEPYYVKYAWKTSDGVESNYKGGIFPSSSIVPSVSSSKGNETIQSIRYSFTSSDLSDSILTITTTGNITGVIDDSGKAWNFGDEEVIYNSDTVSVDLSGILAKKGIESITGTWNIMIYGMYESSSSFETQINNIIGEKK